MKIPKRFCRNIFSGWRGLDRAMILKYFDDQKSVGFYGAFRRGGYLRT